MQQPPTPPPAGPGTPYGGTPYAPPPPSRRGPGFAMYCLGCMGIVAVIAIAFITMRVKKAMGPPITAATVQTVLPPGVPLYPGLTLVESASRNITLPSKVGGRRMAVLTFQAPHAMGVIGPWYQDRLTKQGWIGGMSPTDPNAYQFKKGNMVLSLNEKPAEDGSGILTMSIVEGVPPGSGTMPAPPPSGP